MPTVSVPIARIAISGDSHANKHLFRALTVTLEQPLTLCEKCLDPVRMGDDRDTRNWSSGVKLSRETIHVRLSS